MSGEVTRRTLLRGSLAAGAAAVVGFDTALRGWVSAAELPRGRFALAEGFPVFDRSLLTDGASLAAVVLQQPLLSYNPPFSSSITPRESYS